MGRARHEHGDGRGFPQEEGRAGRLCPIIIARAGYPAARAEPWPPGLLQLGQVVHDVTTVSVTIEQR
jgi:hypothetical protein